MNGKIPPKQLLHYCNCKQAQSSFSIISFPSSSLHLSVGKTHNSISCSKTFTMSYYPLKYHLFIPTDHHLQSTFPMPHFPPCHHPIPLYIENDLWVWWVFGSSTTFFASVFLGTRKNMGFLRSEGVVYKPVDELDDNDEVYISPIVTGLFLFILHINCLILCLFFSFDHMTFWHWLL